MTGVEITQEEIDALLGREDESVTAPQRYQTIVTPLTIKLQDGTSIRADNPSSAAYTAVGLSIADANVEEEVEQDILVPYSAISYIVLDFNALAERMAEFEAEEGEDEESD